MHRRYAWIACDDSALVRDSIAGDSLASCAAKTNEHQNTASIRLPSAAAGIRHGLQQLTGHSSSQSMTAMLPCQFAGSSRPTFSGAQ